MVVLVTSQQPALASKLDAVSTTGTLDSGNGFSHVPSCCSHSFLLLTASSCIFRVNDSVAYGRVCPCAAQIAATYAGKEIAHMKEGSAIFESEEEEQGSTCSDPAADTMLDKNVDDCCRCKHGLPLLNAEDLIIGDKLGEGGYCNVNLCKLSRGEEAGQTFAVKYLKRKTMADLHHFKHGAADLALEAQYVWIWLGTTCATHIVSAAFSTDWTIPTLSSFTESPLDQSRLP